MAIRPDTDPKNASPRSGAPKGELEQYGVWVKAEPQDIVEEVALPEGGDLDFDIPVESTTVAEESFLSADEEKILDSFDSELDSPSLSSPLEDTGPLPDIEDMPPLDDGFLTPAPETEEIKDFDISVTDMKLEEHDASSSFSSINPGVEIDMSSVEGLDIPKSPSPESSSPIEDVSSEFFENTAVPPVHVDAAQGDKTASSMDDVTSEFLDIDDSAAPQAAESETVSDFEPLDIDLHFDEGPEAQSPRKPDEKASGFEEVTEFDDFLTEEPPSPSVKKAGFDDVSAVERELSSPTPSSAAPKPDLSTEILLKIADELASIKGELVSLKSQIGDVMVSMDNAPKKTAEELLQDEEPAPKSGGFFDDEEDETIALTGDELDNILNTADFTTEEAAEAEEPTDLPSGESVTSEPEATMPPDESSLLSESLLPETGDYSPPTVEAEEAEAEPAIEELRIGEDEEVEELEGEGLESLGLDAEEGVTPLTPAPEDTTYLETPGNDDSFASPPPDDTGLDGATLGDAPLVEPDLSEFDLSPEDLEPRPEIDEELPLASGDENGAIEPEPEIEELTLDIDAGSDYASAAKDGATEAELLEPVPEIEEPNFAEISLHEESKSPDLSDVTELEDIDEFSDADLLAVEPQALGEEPAARTKVFEPPVEDIAPLEEEEDLILATEDEAPNTPSAPPASPLAAPETTPKPAPRQQPTEPKAAPAAEVSAVEEGDHLKSEIKSVLSYLDKLLDSLPEEKIEEFARSKYFDTYKKLFEELGLV